MTEEVGKYEVKAIDPLICTIRGQKVILDYDLAAIYGVSTKRLNEQVKRNADRFPDDFAFRLTPEEIGYLKSEIATSSSEVNRSQIATGLQRHRDPRFLPYAFTEHGALMVANVLRSKRAIQMSVFVVRAFIRMRRMLISQQDLARKLTKLEKQLTARLDAHEIAITEVLQQIMRWLNPPREPEPPKKKIGFLVEEPHARYKPSNLSKANTPRRKSILTRKG